MNPKVFCDRRPLCDLQDSSICASLTIFRKPNSHYDLHADSSKLFVFEEKLFRLRCLTQCRGDAMFRKGKLECGKDLTTRHGDMEKNSPVELRFSEPLWFEPGSLHTTLRIVLTSISD